MKSKGITWGADCYASKPQLKSGIGNYLVQELDNNKLSTVVIGGVEYNICLSVSLVKK
jgi:hypothetical protein